MKKSIIALFGVLSMITARAQVERVYLDADRQITDRGNAEYYRIKQQYKINENPENGERHYMVMEYFLSDRIRMVGSFLTEKAVMKDGPFVFYHSNGREKERGSFHYDRRVGLWEFWGESGKLLEERKYFYDSDEGLDQEYLMLNVYDEEGQPIIKEGKGTYERHYEKGQLEVKGKILKGKKEGIWHGYYPDGKTRYVENFQGGKLVKGISYDDKGKKYEYQKYHIKAQSKKGMDDFYTYVKRKMRYPERAKMRGVEGEVLVQVTIDEKGDRVGTKVVKGIGAGCDEEALSLISNGPSWKPGIKRGQAEMEKIVVSITFKLGTL